MTLRQRTHVQYVTRIAIRLHVMLVSMLRTDGHATCARVASHTPV